MLLDHSKGKTQVQATPSKLAKTPRGGRKYPFRDPQRYAGGGEGMEVGKAREGVLAQCSYPSGSRAARRMLGPIGQGGMEGFQPESPPSSAPDEDVGSWQHQMKVAQEAAAEAMVTQQGVGYYARAATGFTEW